MNEIEKKLWKQVKKDPAGCWLWTGRNNRYGYGTISVYAHRVSWELEKGPVPVGLYVLHTCDNRRCVNPKHLFLGTRAENIQDMIGKGRYKLGSRKGELNGRAILTPTQVHEIRERYVPGKNQYDGNCSKLAREFGVHPTTILGIANRRIWGTYK